MTETNLNWLRNKINRHDSWSITKLRGKLQGQALHMDRAMEARYQPEPGIMQNYATKAGDHHSVNHFTGHSPLVCSTRLLPPTTKTVWTWTLLIGQTWVPRSWDQCSLFHSQSLITEGFPKHGEGPNCWIVQGRGREWKMFTIHLN